MVALLEVDAFKPDQVHVQWWLGDGGGSRRVRRSRLARVAPRRARRLQRQRQPRAFRAVGLAMPGSGTT